jgi:hypothetical protein
MKVNNYARHRSTGEVVLLIDGMLAGAPSQRFQPKRPEDWAIWRPVERLRSMRRIGEDPDVYLLRQLQVGVAGREAAMLKRRWKREGLSNEDRAKIEVLAKAYLRETFHVN